MMNDDRKRSIYDRTNGRCHICGKKLAFKNYGAVGARAAWEVDHSRPRAKGGSDHGNNLYPACIPCNRSKGAQTSRTARAKHGRTRAPLSKEARERARRKNTWAGGVTGLAVGALVGGPVGALFLSGIGALVGSEIDPE